MARQLVTGGAGFVGSHIAEALLARGDEVVIVDNLSTGKLSNVSSFRDRIEFMEGDLSDPDVAKRAVRGVDTVFHEAALGSVPKSVADPWATHVANVNGTLQLLIAAREEGVRCVVNAGSSSAYGDTPELPKRETMPPNPLSPYAVTKLAQEQYCRAFSSSYGMRTVTLRYFNVFGPRQDPFSQYAAVIPKFFEAYLKGEAPIIFGDGEQTRDFTFISDVVAANLSASALNDARGEVFNIAGGRAISINDLAALIRELTRGQAFPRHLEARKGDIRHSLADVSRAKEKLEFSCKVSLESGLERCLEWYRDHSRGK